jgi:hypothetical protein
VLNATKPIRSSPFGVTRKTTTPPGVPETETNSTLPSCVDTEANGEPGTETVAMTAATFAAEAGATLATRTDSASSANLTPVDFRCARGGAFQPTLLGHNLQLRVT